MRRGRPWHGAEWGEPYPRRIRRFLEPCLLLLLHKRDAHGYELAEAVKPFGFDERNPVDASLIYRTLRWLERQGMVVSTWDTTSSAGPARRVYHLTEAGDRYLAAWMADLRETAHMLAAFLAEYDQHMAEEQGTHQKTESTS
nr:helix-turn-helix transcriptional regulator [Chloroflexota bacterium]